MKHKVAVLLTVFNRKEVTLHGLASLYTAMKPIEENYSFDVYMVDDGCTDGTPEAVKEQFPDIHIIEGDGNLYWSGGMRKAWDIASKTQDYDYYLWVNDDVDLYENALNLLFLADEELQNKAVVSGAFCDKQGNASYGGRTQDEKLISPDGTYQNVFLMNGNLVLIPACIFEKTGNIDSIYKHPLGDCDYGRRAAKAGFRVVVTKEYVGKTDRHDARISEPFLNKYPLKTRLKKLYSPIHDPRISWFFNIKHMGIIRALRVLIVEHVYVLFPFMAEFRCKMKDKL